MDSLPNRQSLTHQDPENCNPVSSSRIRIFIGEQVQYRSEHDCLIAAYDTLSEFSGWAYIFANFNAAGRQIDLAIFTESITLVIEVKGYALPVKGGLNGLWEQLGPYGARKIGNGYTQALNAKNALRDEIQQLCQINGYPGGAVVVTPGMSSGMRLPKSDFKVSVIGLNEIAGLLKRPTGALLTQNLCETLTTQLNLEEVSSADAALNANLLLAERACNSYIKAFHEFYKPVVADLVGDQYSCAEVELSLMQVQKMAISDESGLLICGPSGCGKTLLTTSCAISLASLGHIPIFVSAHNFNGEFRQFLEKEVALLIELSAISIIASSSRLSRRVVLFVDGYNECQDHLKVTLTRSLKAFTRRYGAGVVISTQQDIVRADVLTTTTISLKRPSDEFKARLAKIEKSGDRTGNFHYLLQVANSCLEACLVGKIGAFLPAGASRFALFDTYARRRLGPCAAEGIRVLSLFAETLVHRACFNISVRQFDRLCDSANISLTARQHLDASQLIQTRNDRVGFIHELFFAAFSAEAAIRFAAGDVIRIRAAFEAPRFFASKAFILGAIEDDLLIHEVLENLIDENMLVACNRGECGAVAQSVVKIKIERLLQAMIAEAKTICFQAVGDNWGNVKIDENSLHPELEEFGFYLAAIGQGLMEGQHFDAVMAGCRNIDYAISNFLNDCSTDARAKSAELRHEAFSAAFVWHREAAISKLMSFIHSGGLSFQREEGPDLELVLRGTWPQAETAGQFYFLIALTKSSECNWEMARYVVKLLRTIRSYPYHLQLDLIDFAGCLRHAEEPFRTEIIEALQATLDKLGVMMNTIIFEALNGMGALEEEEQDYTSVVRREIADSLSKDSEEADQAAWGIFSSQFDHPFDAAYWDEVQGLDTSQKKRLLTKAARGADSPHVSFVGILIRQLSEFNDASAASEIARWTRLPDKQSFMPQDAIEVFVAAHEAMGHLGAQLPLFRGEPKTAAERALLACGELYYWANQIDADGVQDSLHIAAARAILLDENQCAAAGTLRLTTSHVLSIDGARKSLIGKYPSLCVAICRAALKRPHEQVSYFERGFYDDQDSIATFAIQVLGQVGVTEDLKILRHLCDHKRLGVGSLEAIKKIENRTHTLRG